MLRCLRVGHLVPARAAAVQRVENSAENMENLMQGKVARAKNASTRSVNGAWEM